jgi:N-acetylneuraminic acid mutarotase
MINRINWFLLLLILAIVTPSCSDDDEEDLVGNWAYTCDFGGMSRTDAVSFVIGNYAYVGTGYNGTEDEYLKDFWRYDGSAWSQVAPFPGVARRGAVAFVANGKAYVGTGTDGTTDDEGIIKFKDFYEYDPVANTWTQIADFSGSGRYGAVAFGIDNCGYVGTGYDDDPTADFYKYNTTSKEWSPVASMNFKRQDATAFVIDGKGYVVTGSNSNSYLKYFQRYDPSTNQWTDMHVIIPTDADSFDDDYSIKCSNTVSFVIGTDAYITTGGQGSAGSSTWKYNSLTDRWTQKSDFEGSGRSSAVAFALNGKGYVATGNSSGYYLGDVWTFYPDADQDDEDN